MNPEETAREIIRLFMSNLQRESRRIEQLKNMLDDRKQAIAFCKDILKLKSLFNSEIIYEQAVAYLYMSTSYYVEGKYERALESYENCREHFLSMYDKHGEGIACLGMGLTYRALGEVSKACTSFEKSHEIFLRLSDNYARLKDGSKAILYRNLCEKAKSYLKAMAAPSPLRFIPIYGRTAAGEPVYASPYTEGIIEVDKIALPDEKYGREYKLHPLREQTKAISFNPNDTYFALTVKGDSMVDAGLNDGDLILIKKQDAEPEQGQIAVVQIDEGTVVKRVRYKHGRIHLESANSKYTDYIYPEEALKSDPPPLQFLGIVVAKLEAM